MSTPAEGGRALLRGRVLGFPVHLDLSFVLIIGLIGYSRSRGVRDLVLWVAIATLAVLAHELGHAVAARSVGAQPQIALVGFGGLTTFTPPQPLSRVRSLGISLAGPGVGLALGLPLLLLWLTVRDQLDPAGWQASSLVSGMETCLGWSVLNLLPVLPLDGGQAMRELLPGDPEVRSRRAAVVSIVTAGLAAVAAYLFGMLFLALFMLFFGLNNVLVLRQLAGERRAATEPGTQLGPSAGGTPEQFIVGLLWRSDPAGARRLMEELPPGTPVDLAVHGAVLALTGDRDGGHALLAQEVQRRPGDVNAVALLLLTQALEHDWDAVLTTLDGPLGPCAPETVVARAIAEAQGSGREDVAGRLTTRRRPA
jgi:Zn-dependent protease